jgi:Alginate lyase
MLSPISRTTIVLGLGALCWFAARTGQAQVETNLPRVFYADAQVLARARAGYLAGDASLKPAAARLFADAAGALKFRPPSVMDKHRVPPSGDKHDYVSQAPYYWRATNSPVVRYIRRDGERNPEANLDSDAGNLAKVCSSVQTLALAYYFSGDDKYAAKAGEILRVWFLNPATRMNPNLDFGQGIPNQVDGRPSGLITARAFVEVVDALGLLAGSPAWTAADSKGMQDWMTQYFHWLTTSKIGLGEAHAKNNHGSHYDVQACAIALYLGNPEFARQTFLAARTNRIALQIEPDGREPLELVRTRSFSYSVFNLRALVDLATLAEHQGVDLWHYATADGRSIAQGLAFVAPYTSADRKWPFQQIIEPNRAELGELLLRAAPEYPDRGFAAALKAFPADQFNASRSRLLFKVQAD